MSTFTNPNARPIQNNDILIIQDINNKLHKYKWQDVNSYVDTTTGAITATTLTATGAVDLQSTLGVTGITTLTGKLDMNNLIDLDDTQDGGASNCTIFQKTLQAGETYSGTIGGLVVKNYDADATVAGSGENVGLAIFLKSLSTVSSAETSIMSLHTHSSTTQKLTNGVVIYPKDCGSIIQARDCTADYGLDLYGVANVTIGTADIRGSNGETIDNTTDGIWATTGGKIDGITPVAAGSYDLLTTDNILHVTYTTTGAVAIDLKTAQAVAGRHIVIKDGGGLAGTNNITVSTEGAETIDGAATAVISTNYNSINLYSDGANWFIY